MSQLAKNQNTKYIDYLKEDPPIPGQLWVCVSFLSPEGVKNCTLRGLKVRGIYGTRQEADKKAEELQKIDPDFHVFVGEVGKWLPWDPEPTEGGADQVYQEKELNDLMKGYKDNLEKAKKMENDRKDSMIREAAREEQSRENKTKDRLKKKLETRKQEKSKEVENTNPSNKELELKQLSEKLKQEDELLKAEKNRLDETNKEINETAQNLGSIDSKLAKIQELYERLNNLKK
jgi:hypothetical protein